MGKYQSNVRMFSWTKLRKLKSIEQKVKCILPKNFTLQNIHTRKPVREKIDFRAIEVEFPSIEIDFSRRRTNLFPINEN